MKTVDYINTLIKEKEELKELCKSHVETIRLLKREIGILNIAVLKKDKRIQKLEENKSTDVEKIQIELDAVKNELNIEKEKYNELQSRHDDISQSKVNMRSQKSRELSKLKSEYNALKQKYEDVVSKNEAFMRIFDEIESTCDSD
jgi:chromosome segregation ATPase